MREPVSTLPLDIVSKVVETKTIVDFLSRTIDQKDYPYIVQACNEFPEAIQLLRRTWVYLASIGKHNSMLGSDIEEYLARIDEDQTHR